MAERVRAGFKPIRRVVRNTRAEVRDWCSSDFNIAPRNIQLLLSDWHQIWFCRLTLGLLPRHDSNNESFKDILLFWFHGTLKAFSSPILDHSGAQTGRKTLCELTAKNYMAEGCLVKPLPKGSWLLPLAEELVLCLESSLGSCLSGCWQEKRMNQILPQWS